MATKLRKVPSPQIQRVEAKLIESIEELMRAMLDNPMSIEDKKEILKKITRLSSGL